MPQRDWDRVAKAVRTRRERLGIKREDMTASASTVFKLETAGQESYKSFNLRRVEVDLGWPAGTIDVIADGGPVPDQEATPAVPDASALNSGQDLGRRIASLEAGLRTANAQLGALIDLIEELTDRNQGDVGGRQGRRRGSG